MLVIGSRGSPLALWQANHVQGLLAAQGVESAIEVIRTSGDKLQSASLAVTGSKSLFTKEIEDALLEGRVHLAVHSLKDLSTTLPEGLVLAASPARENPRDAMMGRALEHLSTGARVGTSSVRRAAQLLRIRPDLRMEPIRGNVDTRLRKLDAGEFEATLLASAGLHRLGLTGRIAQEFSFEEMCPAPGQGALGLETLAEGAGFAAARLLNHADTWAAVSAERALLAALGGGCQLPVGAIAQLSGGVVAIDAVVISLDGRTQIRDSISGPAGEYGALGAALGQKLLDSGARELLAHAG